MRTIRFEKPDIQFSANGLIITGKCYDDKAIFVPYSRIKTVEFNKNLLQADCYGQQEHYFIVCNDDEYYEIEGRAQELSMSLKELLEKIN